MYYKQNFFLVKLKFSAMLESLPKILRKEIPGKRDFQFLRSSATDFDPFFRKKPLRIEIWGIFEKGGSFKGKSS